MKVYHLPNLDGLVEALVAASTIGEAADAFGVPVRVVRQRGWKRVKGAGAAPALAEPGRAVYRNLLGRPDRWSADLAATRDRAARAATAGASGSD